MAMCNLALSYKASVNDQSVQHVLTFLANFVSGNAYLNSSIIFIIIGCVILVVAFFGCCGACTENGKTFVWVNVSSPLWDRLVGRFELYFCWKCDFS